MSMRPIARPAVGDAERLSGLAIRHEAYGRTMPLAQYQAARLRSRREHRATPWVLDRGDGTLVATLLRHDLVLSTAGSAVPAYGLGSVGTLPAHRKQGYAAMLCRAACEDAELAGRRVGLLYSDIGAPYYERLGFRVAPAVRVVSERLDALAGGDASLTLVPIDPRRDVDRLLHDWTQHHEGSLHSFRDRERFLESVEDGIDDLFFAVAGDERGYVRLEAWDDGSLAIVEPIVAPERLEPVIRAVARLALGAKRRAVGGWFEPPASLCEAFTVESPPSSLPMLRGLAPPSSVLLWPTDHF
jgi:predicted N-acetyltransferase YhbS